MNMRNRYDLGHFRLLERVGSGGYGDVYRALDLYLQREVAIKVFKAHINPRNIRAVKRQTFEGRILAHLRHPHIVRIIDFGIEGTTPYSVMEYANNGNLRDAHPPGTRLEWDTILNYLEQITEALTFVHLHNIVHQDIKPENMLVNENGEILLSDFGTVALIGRAELYTSHQFIGTIRYAAPERFLLETPTPASDIYSLAIVVFEWYTGESLFTGSYAEIIHQHCFVKPSARRMSASGISRPIQRVLLKALFKAPERRYQTASDFFYALRNAVEKTEKRQALRALLVTVLIASLITSLLVLLFHFILILCVALPLLLILSAVILFRENIL